jgi:hypothetical protein
MSRHQVEAILGPPGDYSSGPTQISDHLAGFETHHDPKVWRQWQITGPREFEWWLGDSASIEVLSAEAIKKSEPISTMFGSFAPSHWPGEGIMRERPPRRTPWPGKRDLVSRMITTLPVSLPYHQLLPRTTANSLLRSEPG